MTKPRACPFCRCEIANDYFFAVRRVPASKPPKVETYIFCVHCDAEGPKVPGENIEYAIERWNG